MTTAPRAAPTKIDEFLVSRNQPIASLHFSEDGTSISAVSANGHSLKVFKLRPIPSIIPPSLEIGESARRALAAHVYDLRRGRTSAVVEGVDWAKDGRWVALGTRNRTVHVFGVNPYGGKPDIRSHLEGRVRNVDVVEPRMSTLGPLARLRASKAASSEQLTAPLAFTFVSSNGLSASPDLLPPLSPPPVSHSPSSPSFSPSSRGKRGANYQHVLVFDPEEGVLSLRRLTLDKHLVREQGIGGVAASVQVLGVTSISLPGMGSSGRLSSSPSSAAKTGAQTAAARVVDPPTELGAKESEVATWNLGRERGWEEIKRPMVPNGRGVKGPSAGGEWFSEAELSTCSNSARVLPRSLYLSHQFSFHTLGEEYQTLLRRYQFDFSGAKIEVRKAVEISAYASGGGNSAFVEGYSSPRDIRRPSSSFDEPLASAISGSFDNSNLPAILPMYPNGIPGSKPKSA
ncbi:hypothetical protein NLJ89_g11995 [Agrocybe chaxingu]|uniref:BCAS3 WD40 domain-containing protein n=1 Tax=Agrocybe chaxingu TaxID=84603 RepID=A0A9W8MQN8_9AGAR|nr:hypothetical protein NLJ89_g11995 [Agrocybe chaxingu]